MDTRYRDFDISFRKNPISKDVNALTDIDAVKRSVKLLVLTKFYERRLTPYIGSLIYSQLFENITPLTLLNVKRTIADVINNFEPRADLLDVRVKASPDTNTLTVNIYFSIVNLPDTYTVSLNLERVR